MEIPTLKCLRCKHTWIPRKPVTMVCPKCHSAYWNTPKQPIAVWSENTGTWSDTPPENWATKNITAEDFEKKEKE